MTSKKNARNEAYVWLWLPDEVKPVVAGKLTFQGGLLVFNYGRSYLERKNAIAIYDKELPLRSGILEPRNGLHMPSCIRDASPDAWGRRIIINRLLGLKSPQADTSELDELTYLLESGSDRIGALDFQYSATEYQSRESKNTSLEELQEVVERVEKGLPLNSHLENALNHGTSIGGARPKVFIDHENVKYVAKFSSSSDIYNVVKTEYIAMRLAKLAGLNVANVSLTKAAHKDVLLVERFDRLKTRSGWSRRIMISALTMLGLDEMLARYASYQELTHIIRKDFANPQSTLKELFGRIVFNILSGNTDDHARNHAAFWDGAKLSLTPAYDICPQLRVGNEASQAMLISDGLRKSQLSTCLQAAHNFMLNREEATALIEQQITCIRENWQSVCDAAELSEVDRNLMWQRQFLNPYAFEDWQSIGFGCNE